jgi:hypothetical protein
VETQIYPSHTFDLISLVLSNNSQLLNELYVNHRSIYESIPDELSRFDKTPREIIDEILTTNSKSFDLKNYKENVDHLYLWLNFLIGACEKSETLKKPCEEYFQWVKEYYKSVREMHKDVNGCVNRKYDPVASVRRFERKRNQYLPALTELRKIFYVFENGLEQSLFENLNIQSQKPDNPVPD